MPVALRGRAANMELAPRVGRWVGWFVPRAFINGRL